MKIIKTTSLISGFLMAALSANGTILAYEGFDTANALFSDATVAGVTGTGFSAYADTNFRMDLENGLSYTDGVNTLVTSGKSAGMDSAVSGTQNLQLTLSSPISSGTVYFSYLVNTTAVTSWGVQIGFMNAAVGNSASPTSGLLAGTTSSSSNDRVYGDGGIDSRTGPATGTGLDFIVGEINLDNSTVTAWWNPTNLLDPTNSAAATATDSIGSSMSALNVFVFSLGGEEAGVIDEIRVGTTLGDVVPVPEPSAIAMILGLVALGFVVRRRSQA